MSTARSAGRPNAEDLLRVLRRLSGHDTAIVEAREGAVVEYCFVRHTGGASLSGGAVKSDVVLQLRTLGLVEKRGTRLVLSDAGRARLRRAGMGDFGFQAQHVDLQHVDLSGEDGSERVMRNVAESPLSWLRSRKGSDGKPMLSAPQFEAGERLRRDFTKAQLMPRLGADWSAFAIAAQSRQGAGAGRADLADHVIDARARVNKALSAVGRDFAGPLVDICCLLRGVEEVERINRWPRRSGKLVLQLALNVLALHYGLLPSCEVQSHQVAWPIKDKPAGQRS